MDSGYNTGIATIHEGKLYTAKVVGDLDCLLRETNAAELPGTVGIIHSRTPGNYLTHAHPFLSADKEGAFVLNGTFNTAKSDKFREKYVNAVNKLYERGVVIDSAIENKDPNNKFVLPDGRTYHRSEFYALTVGEAVKNSAEEDMAKDMAKAFYNVLSEYPADIVMLGVHKRLRDTVTVGTVTRPMNCGFGDGETYLATSAMAFPEEVQKRPVIPIPPTTVAQATPEGLKICSTSLEGTKVEQIDYRIAAYVRSEMERLLLEGPVAIPEMPCRGKWLEVWSEPMFDTEYSYEGGFMKSYATILYECLWSFHKEGRLRRKDVPNPKDGHPLTRFWLEGGGHENLF